MCTFSDLDFFTSIREVLCIKLCPICFYNVINSCNQLMRCWTRMSWLRFWAPTRNVLGSIPNVRRLVVSIPQPDAEHLCLNWLLLSAE